MQHGPDICSLLHTLDTPVMSAESHDSLHLSQRTRLRDTEDATQRKHHLGDAHYGQCNIFWNHLPLADMQCCYAN